MNCVDRMRDKSFGKLGINAVLRSSVAIVIALSASTAWADDDRESAFRGKRIAEANCAICHAIGGHDTSTLSAAPPLREIGSRTGQDRLNEMLLGAVFLEHAAMPDFEPSDEQAADLATYIRSIAAP